MALHRLLSRSRAAGERDIDREAESRAAAPCREARGDHRADRGAIPRPPAHADSFPAHPDTPVPRAGRKAPVSFRPIPAWGPGG